jgi:HlyD family secretion protein
VELQQPSFDSAVSRRWPWFRPWMIAVPVVIAVTAGIVIKSRKPAAAEAAKSNAVLTVAVQPAAMRPLVRRLAVTGTVAAWDLLSVYPAAQGLRIMHLSADEGDRVGAGQVLALLDDASLQAQLAAAQARLANAEAQLAKMRRPNRSQDIASLEAALRQAEANVHSAEDVDRRTKELVAQGAVSSAEATARDTALAAAKAGADQARQRLSMAREGSRVEDLRIAEAGVAAERANVRQLQVQLAQTRVTAPAGGLILSRSAHLGDVAGPSLRLFQLVRDDRYELQAQLPEADLRDIKPDQPVTIGSDADPTLKLTGKVRIVSPVVDNASRQGTVRIDLDPDPKLRVGMFVRGRIDLGEVQMIAVPSAAVLNREGTSSVFVLEGDIARSRKVVTAVRSDSWLGVTTGLNPGDAVVIAGAGYLKDGDRVRIAPALGQTDDPAAGGSEAQANASEVPAVPVAAAGSDQHAVP